jgi:hypothetical protein
MMPLSGNQRRLDTHLYLPVHRCGLPPSRLMVKSQKGHANVASPCRLMDSNRKRNPAHLTRHTGINLPDFTIPNFSKPNQESPPRSLQRTNSIKWTNIYKVRLSHNWHQFATAHVRSKRLDLRAQEWGPKFVTAMWDHSLRIWQFRNDAFHADTNAQVKRYKLEELEREKYVSDPDTHNSNHYFISSNRNISIH